MTEFVTHEGVDTVDGRVARVGGTRRLRVVAPGAEPPNDDVVRLDVDGTTYSAPVSVTGDASLAFDGAYDSPSLARSGAGTNHLVGFFDDHGLDDGRTVHVDVVSAGFRYGLRAPGQRATYRDTRGPRSSLADIARDLDG